MSWLRTLCFPPLESPHIPAGSASRYEEPVNSAELHDGNSVPAPLAALGAYSLSSPPGMEMEGWAVMVLSPLHAFLWAGCAGGRTGCVWAEGWGCRWSRTRSWAPPAAAQGSSSREVRVGPLQVEGLRHTLGTGEHSLLHLHFPPPPDLQSQSWSRSRSGPASQRRSL